MKKLFVSIVAMLLSACLMFVAFAEDAENSQLVKDAEKLISAATADERQEIFKDLIWYMIFVDGADAVEEAFSVVGTFFAGDSMPTDLIPEDFDVSGGEAQQLTDGQAVENEDSYIIEVVNSEMTAKLVPADTDGVYSYFEAGSGKKYAVVCVNFTNLYTEGIRPEDIIECELTYDGKYKYNGNVAVELNGDFVQGGDILPLCSEKVCLFFEVPDMVAESEASIEVGIRVNNSADYIYMVR